MWTANHYLAWKNRKKLDFNNEVILVSYYAGDVLNACFLCLPTSVCSEHKHWEIAFVYPFLSPNFRGSKDILGEELISIFSKLMRDILLQNFVEA